MTRRASARTKPARQTAVTFDTAWRLPYIHGARHTFVHVLPPDPGEPRSSPDARLSVVFAGGSRLETVCDCLIATLAVHDPLQGSIEREELSVGGERGRERESVGKAQRGVPGSELRGLASESTIDIDHVCVDRGKELIDLGVGAVLQRTHDHLGVHSRRDQDVNTRRKVRCEQLDRLVMLRVGRI